MAKKKFLAPVLPLVYKTLFIIHYYLFYSRYLFSSQGWSLIKLKIIYSAPIFHLVLIAFFTLLVGFLFERVFASYVFQPDRDKGTSKMPLILPGE